MKSKKALDDMLENQRMPKEDVASDDRVDLDPYSKQYKKSLLRSLEENR